MSYIERIIRDVLDATEVDHLITVDNVEQLTKELTEAIEEALSR